MRIWGVSPDIEPEYFCDFFQVSQYKKSYINNFFQKNMKANTRICLMFEENTDEMVKTTLKTAVNNVIQAHNFKNVKLPRLEIW